MKWLKYLGSVACALYSVGTLPPAILIARGLIAGGVDDPAYFTGRLLVYLVLAALSGALAIWLWKSASR